MLFKAITDEQFIVCKQGEWRSKKYKGVYYFDPGDRALGNVRMNKVSDFEKQYFINLCKQRKYEESQDLESLIKTPKSGKKENLGE